MTFEENPFRVLQVSLYDTKATINERADELSFEEPEREELFEQARTILLNPKKRIAAEVWQIVGEKIFYPFESCEEILEVDKNFSVQNAKSIRQQINAARAKSKFPAVQDTAEIKSELKNIRYAIREKVRDSLKVYMSHKEKITFASELADMLVTDKEKFGAIIEDFFDVYRLEMTPRIEGLTAQINYLLEKIQANAYETLFYDLKRQLEDFSKVIKPLDKFSIALGTNNFDESEEIFYSVRSVAIELIDEPLKITRILEENFSYLSKPIERIREDIKFLEEAKANRPTQSFLDSKAALDKIQSSLDNALHFKDGFEQANLNFYEKYFKPHHEYTLRSVMIKDGMKSDEWKFLNIMATAIYVKVGNAMTWTYRADFALDCFKKALPYAEATGDDKWISGTRKRIDEWKKINEQIAATSKIDIYAKPKDDSSGCLWWIGIIFLLIILFS